MSVDRSPSPDTADLARRALERMPNLVAILDHDGGCRWANAAARHRLPGASVGFDGIAPEIAVALGQSGPVTVACTDGAGRRLTGRLSRIDHGTALLQIDADPRPAEGLRRLAERMRQEEAALRAERAHRRALEVERDRLAIIMRELSGAALGPLARIESRLGVVAVLAAGTADDTLIGEVEDLRRRARDCRERIGGLGRYAIGGQSTLEPVAISPRALFGELLQTAETAGRAAERAPHLGDLPWMSGDRALTSAIFRRLLSAVSAGAGGIAAAQISGATVSGTVRLEARCAVAGCDPLPGRLIDDLASLRDLAARQAWTVGLDLGAAELTIALEAPDAAGPAAPIEWPETA